MTLPLAYNWRNLFVRKLSTSLTFLVVAVIVAVLAVLMSFAEGINESLLATGHPTNLIILRTGATAESTSLINPDDANKILQAPGIARSESGEFLVSREVCAQTTLTRKDGKGIANVAVRGVDDLAFAVHDEVVVTAGRSFLPGKLEIIVGKAARERYENLDVGDILSLGRSGNRDYEVVGIFEAGGGALESEIWAARSNIADSFRRTFISSVFLRLTNTAALQQAIDYIQGPAVRQKAKRETDYYEDLTSKTREIVILTSVLITLMGIGAVFAVANTMYASVDSRKREIAMLRTIGFWPGAIIAAFVVESVMICSAASLAGLSAGFFLTQVIAKQDFLSDTTWTVLAYELRISPLTISVAVGLAFAVGVFGGLAPALRASRTNIIQALRKA